MADSCAWNPPLRRLGRAAPACATALERADVTQQVGVEREVRRGPVVLLRRDAKSLVQARTRTHRGPVPTAPTRSHCSEQASEKRRRNRRAAIRGARRCRSGRISPPRGLVLELGEGTGEAATLTGVGRT